MPVRSRLLQRNLLREWLHPKNHDQGQWESWSFALWCCFLQAEGDAESVSLHLRQETKDGKSQTQSHLSWPPGWSFSARHPGCCLLSSFVLWIHRMLVAPYPVSPPPSSVYVLFLFILSLISNLFPSSFISLASASCGMLIFPGILPPLFRIQQGSHPWPPKSPAVELNLPGSPAQGCNFSPI